MKGGRSSSKSASEEYKKGLWTVEEDKILEDYVKIYGKGKWNRVAKLTELKRCGKSCRLRWINYLSPDIKHDNFCDEEDDLIIRLHKLLGNRWSLIAGRIPGRTDNQVKNHWNTHLSKKLGVKKEKCKVTITSSGFSKELKNNFESAFNLNCTPNHNDKVTSRNVTGHGGSNAMVEDASAEGLPVGDYDWDHNSFLFLNHEYPNLYTPNLMEFVDESLEFWCNF